MRYDPARPQADEAVAVCLPGDNSEYETVAEGGLSRRSVYLLIVLLGLISALGPLAIDMYLPSFPAIAADFGSSVSRVQRTLAAYFVGLALGQLFYGPATDWLGRKPPLYAGLALFGVASAGCAAAGSIEWLTAMRFLQALGGCSVIVVSRAVVRDRFDERDAAWAFSSLMLVMGLAPMLAPLMGGWMLVHFGWRSLFWVLALFACFCLLIVTVFLRESHPVRRRRRQGPRAIVRAYVSLLRDRTFLVHTLASGLASAGMFAYIGGSPFVFMEIFGVPPERFGLFFGANAFGFIAASQVNGALVRRFQPRRLLRGALVVASLSGGVLLFTAATHVGGFAGILVPLFVFIGSLGFIMPTSVALAMAPHGGQAGSASAVLGCLQFLLSGVGGLMVSVLHNGTAVPMALVIAVCGLLALSTNFLGTTAAPQGA